MASPRRPSGKLFKMLKLLKLAIRMLRLARRSRVRRVSVSTATSFAEAAWQSLATKLHPFVWVLLRQILMFGVVVHLFACVEFAVNDANSLLPACAGDGKDAPQCWLYRAGILPPAELNVTTSKITIPTPTIDGATLYLASFFHAAAQMLNGEYGLGGDPVYAHEYVLVLIATLTGIYWQALIIASLTSAVERAGQSSREYRERVEKLNQYARRNKLPKDLRERLQFYCASPPPLESSRILATPLKTTDRLRLPPRTFSPLRSGLSPPPSPSHR